MRERKEITELSEKKLFKLIYIIFSEMERKLRH